MQLGVAWRQPVGLTCAVRLLQRRLATLIAFIRALEATAQNDVLDKFNIVVTRIFVDAQNVGREARWSAPLGLDTFKRLF